MIKEALRIHEKTVAKSIIVKEYSASASQRLLLKTRILLNFSNTRKQFPHMPMV